MSGQVKCSPGHSGAGSGSWRGVVSLGTARTVGESAARYAARPGPRYETNSGICIPTSRRASASRRRRPSEPDAHGYLRPRTVVDCRGAGAHAWQACWGQPLRSSNLLSSATSDQAIHQAGHAFGPARKPRSLICSLIHSSHIGTKCPEVQAHASAGHRGCGRPLEAPVLSDQLPAGAVTMG